MKAAAPLRSVRPVKTGPQMAAIPPAQAASTGILRREPCRRRTSEQAASRSPAVCVKSPPRPVQSPPAKAATAPASSGLARAAARPAAQAAAIQWCEGMAQNPKRATGTTAAQRHDVAPLQPFRRRAHAVSPKKAIMPRLET